MNFLISDRRRARLCSIKHSHIFALDPLHPNMYVRSISVAARPRSNSGFHVAKSSRSENRLQLSQTHHTNDAKRYHCVKCLYHEKFPLAIPAELVFRSRDWLSTNQGLVFPDSVGSVNYLKFKIVDMFLVCQLSHRAEGPVKFPYARERFRIQKKSPLIQEKGPLSKRKVPYPKERSPYPKKRSLIQEKGPLIQEEGSLIQNKGFFSKRKVPYPKERSLIQKKGTLIQKKGSTNDDLLRRPKPVIPRGASQPPPKRKNGYNFSTITPIDLKFCMPTNLVIIYHLVSKFKFKIPDPTSHNRPYYWIRELFFLDKGHFFLDQGTLVVGYEVTPSAEGEFHNQFRDLIGNEATPPLPAREAHQTKRPQQSVRCLRYQGILLRERERERDRQRERQTDRQTETEGEGEGEIEIAHPLGAPQVCVFDNPPGFAEWFFSPISTTITRLSWQLNCSKRALSRRYRLTNDFDDVHLQLIIEIQFNSEEGIKALGIDECRIRPYSVECTRSRSISEVKQPQAGLVLGWVTAWESPVQYPFFNFFGKLINKVTHIFGDFLGDFLGHFGDSDSMNLSVRISQFYHVTGSRGTLLVVELFHIRKGHLHVTRGVLGDGREVRESISSHSFMRVYRGTCNFKKEKGIKALGIDECRIRPYSVECTRSRSISEVKQPQAGLVLGWVTAWESPVQYPFFNFFGKLINKVTHIFGDFLGEFLGHFGDSDSMNLSVRISQFCEELLLLQQNWPPTRDSWRTGGWEGGPRIHQQFQTFQHYFKQINLSIYRETCNLKKEEGIKALGIDECRIRPYSVECTRSRSISEVKQPQAGLVLGWVTAWESPVQYPFFNFFGKLINKVTHIFGDFLGEFLGHFGDSDSLNLSVRISQFCEELLLLQQNWPPTRDSWRTGGWEGGPRLHQQFQTFQHYFKQINLSIYRETCNLKKEEGIKALGIDECRIRPYSVECTRSRSISEVKQPQAGLVLGWVTAWESPVQYPFFNFFGKLINKVTHIFGDFLGEFLGHFGDSDSLNLSVRISQFCEELLLLQQNWPPTRDSWRTGGWEGGPRLHQQFQTFQHYFKQINLSYPSVEGIAKVRHVLACPQCRGNCVTKPGLGIDECRIRPYSVECTRSRSISEVKQPQAGLVLGWVTAWESPVHMNLQLESLCENLTVLPPTRDSWRTGGWEGGPRLHQQFQTFQHYFKQINLSIYRETCNLKKEEGIKALGIDECRIRPYSVECTRSRSISEVKQPQAGLVLGWVTAWESPVQYPFFNFFGKLINKVTHIFGDFLGEFLGHFGDSDSLNLSVRISQFCEELLLLQQNWPPTRDSWRTGGWEGGPRLHQQFQTFQHYFKQINLSIYRETCNLKKEEGIKALGIDECRIRPYSVECTRSRSISEVKQPQAGLVLGWVTAWESPVQYPFFNFFGKLINKVTHIFGDFLGEFLGHFGDSDSLNLSVRISQFCEELLLLQQNWPPTRDSWRTGGWEGGPRLHQQFQTFQHYFKQINLSIYRETCNLKKEEGIKALGIDECRIRPYSVECTRSRSISEVKQPQAGLVLGWVTAWESPVQYPFFNFFGKLINKVTHIFGDFLGEFLGHFGDSDSLNLSVRISQFCEELLLLQQNWPPTRDSWRTGGWEGGPRLHQQFQTFQHYFKQINLR
eukprot:sb/3460760/